MAWPGFSSQPQDAPVTAVPLPVTHVATYRDDGEMASPAPLDVVSRVMGNVQVVGQGGHTAAMVPHVSIDLRVLDAYGVLLVDRTELGGASGWSLCKVPVDGEWSECEEPTQ